MVNAFFYYDHYQQHFSGDEPILCQQMLAFSMPPKQLLRESVTETFFCASKLFRMKKTSLKIHLQLYFVFYGVLAYLRIQKKMKTIKRMTETCYYCLKSLKILRHYSLQRLPHFSLLSSLESSCARLVAFRALTTSFLPRYRLSRMKSLTFHARFFCFCRELIFCSLHRELVFAQVRPRKPPQS